MALKLRFMKSGQLLTTFVRDTLSNIKPISLAVIAEQNNLLL